MYLMYRIVFVLAMFLAIGPNARSVLAKAEAKLIGVKIKVPEIGEAKKFYIDTLGFAIKSESVDKRTVWLKTTSYEVALEESKDARRITVPGYSDVSISMRVNDIDETFRKLKAANVRFIKDEKRKEGIGWSLQVLDPFGNKISMMQITIGKQEPVAEPTVYNCGLYVTDIEKALSTYGELSFVVRSRVYMPEDMPLGTEDGKFAFMLHLRRSDFLYVKSPNMFLMFAIGGKEVIEELRREGSKIRKTHAKNVFLLEDATGVVSELHLDPEGT